MPVTVRSLRDLHLSNTSGHSVNIPANTPTPIPDALWEDAMLAGCIKDGAEEEVAAPAPAAVEPPAGDDDAAGAADEVRNAVLRILARGSEEDLKRDGSPKLKAVQDEIPDGSPKPTATQVYETYAALQSDPSLALAGD